MTAEECVKGKRVQYRPLDGMPTEAVVAVVIAWCPEMDLVRVRFQDRTTSLVSLARLTPIWPKQESLCL